MKLSKNEKDIIFFENRLKEFKEVKDKWINSIDYYENQIEKDKKNKNLSYYYKKKYSTKYKNNIKKAEKEIERIEIEINKIEKIIILLKKGISLENIDTEKAEIIKKNIYGVTFIRVWFGEMSKGYWDEDENEFFDTNYVVDDDFNFDKIIDEFKKEYGSENIHYPPYPAFCNKIKYIKENVIIFTQDKNKFLIKFDVKTNKILKEIKIENENKIDEKLKELV